MKNISAIKIKQPLGDFFIASIKAKDLLEISFSEVLEYKTETGEMKGNQRRINENRLREIGKYIDTAEMTFPNTIILSVNQNENGEIIEDEKYRWKITRENDNFILSFPEGIKTASIIDGQHRINGFKHISNKERLEMDIVCSIFFELPNPYQAYLFATINGNQKQVDKSLALEQFGYFIAKEESISWTPEKLAANINRNLNFSKNSPLFGLIRLAPVYHNEEFVELNKKWIISTATMMEGILSLFSSNYKRDRIEMLNKPLFGGRSRSMVKAFNDRSPLRQLYLNNKDKEIEEIIFNFFKLVKDLLWDECKDDSYIKKTVGIQALFNFLKALLSNSREINEEIFQNIRSIDFEDNYFQASGIGRTRIKNVLLIGSGLMQIDDLKNDSDKEAIGKLLNG